MSAASKLMEARLKLLNTKLTKTGHNKFAGYNYFELGDFLPAIQRIFHDLKLCGVVSYTADVASLAIIDTEDGTIVQITSPMGSAALKGCHEVQNIGAVETYQRRYLWVTAMEIVEHDILDATTGSEKAAPVRLTGKHTPTGGVFESLSPEDQQRITDLATVITDFADSGAVDDAIITIQDAALETEETVALKSRLGSKVRTAIEKELNRRRELKKQVALESQLAGQI